MGVGALFICPPYESNIPGAVTYCTGAEVMIAAASGMETMIRNMVMMNLSSALMLPPM